MSITFEIKNQIVYDQKIKMKFYRNIFILKWISLKYEKVKKLIQITTVAYSIGDFVSELGETVIDEEEFSLIKRLQDLKGRYRDDFEKWRDLKAEIVYCQNLVEQCRQRLVQGKW